MSVVLRRVARAVSRNYAATDKDDPDRRLRGRTYAIPFEQVWQAALALAQGGLRHWHVVFSNDADGVIKAESRTLVLRLVDDVVIRITLDENGQTRVDLESRSRKGFADLGANARRIGKFLRMLDRRLLPRRAQRERNPQPP